MTLKKRICVDLWNKQNTSNL